MAIWTSEKRKDGFQHSQRAVLKGSSLTHKLKALSIWPPLSERSTSGDRCLRVDECMNGSISEWMNTTKTLPTPKWSHSLVWTLYHSLPSLVSCVLMSLCKPSLFTVGQAPACCRIPGKYEAQRLLSGKGQRELSSPVTLHSLSVLQSLHSLPRTPRGLGWPSRHLT